MSSMNTHVVVDIQRGIKSDPMPRLTAMNHALQRAMRRYNHAELWQYRELKYRTSEDGFDVYYGTSRTSFETHTFLVLTNTL